MNEPVYVVKIYEPAVEERMWKGTLHNSVNKHLATALAPHIGLLWAMLEVAIPNYDTEEGE